MNIVVLVSTMQVATTQKRCRATSRIGKHPEAPILLPWYILTGLVPRRHTNLDEHLLVNPLTWASWDLNSSSGQTGSLLHEVEGTVSVDPGAASLRLRVFRVPGYARSLDLSEDFGEDELAVAFAADMDAILQETGTEGAYPRPEEVVLHSWGEGESQGAGSFLLHQWV